MIPKYRAWLPALNWIALHYNCDWSTVRARIYENPELVEGDA